MGELRDVAVIDVGSNSVRLVLYRVDGRSIWTTYNEKVLAGLGRDLGRTGRLSPEGVDEEDPQFYVKGLPVVTFR